MLTYRRNLRIISGRALNDLIIKLTQITADFSGNLKFQQFGKCMYL
jgi:hypothetical protein